MMGSVGSQNPKLLALGFLEPSVSVRLSWGGGTANPKPYTLPWELGGKGLEVG